MPPSLLSARTNLGSFNAIGPMGNIPNSANALYQFEGLFSNLLALLTILGGLYFMFQLIIAGYNYISAGGEKAQVQAAQKKITNNFLGLTIVVLAYLITGIIGRFFGLNIIDLYSSLNLIHP
jgi:hypothetical protein